MLAGEVLVLLKGEAFKETLKKVKVFEQGMSKRARAAKKTKAAKMLTEEHLSGETLTEERLSDETLTGRRGLQRDTQESQSLRAGSQEPEWVSDLTWYSGILALQKTHRPPET
jgi:hypothetical protein